MTAALGMLVLSAILSGGVEPRLSDPGERPPDVVLIVVDTLRADRLGCYGYDRPTSPFMDRLAAEGAVFERHSCQFNWTVPSMVSLMTSRYVTEPRATVFEDRPTLAEVFQGAGYRTLGVVANELVDEAKGFGRGFDHFDSAGSSWAPEGGDSEDHSRNVDELVEAVWGPLDRLLGEDPERASGRPPVLLYLHALDPHAPYQKAPMLEGELPIPESLGVDVPWALKRLDEAGNARDPEEQRTILNKLSGPRGRYDLEVRSVDEGLRTLFEGLRKRGLLERAVVTVCSDHGEGLWDHEAPRQEGGKRRATADKFFYQAHGQTLHQEAVATPWLLWGHGVPPGRRVPQGTENVDLLPTLLELCGIDFDTEALVGRSAVPLLAAAPAGDGLPAWRKYAFSASGHGRLAVQELDTGLKLLVRVSSVPGKPRRSELFDLRADPLERRNLADARPEDTARLLAQLEAWADAHRTEEAAIDPATLEQLERLGYTGADTGLDQR